MTRTLVSSRSDAALTLEAGGWVAYRRPQPRIAADALDLLDRSAAPRRGNLRFALHGRSVCLVGELRACSLPQAEQYFGVTAARPSEEMDAVDVACVLHETGHAWCQPPNVGDRWQTVAHGSRDPAWALTATLVPGGVQVASRAGIWGRALGRHATSGNRPVFGPRPRPAPIRAFQSASRRRDGAFLCGRRAAGCGTARQRFRRTGCVPVDITGSSSADA